MDDVGGRTASCFCLCWRKDNRSTTRKIGEVQPFLSTRLIPNATLSPLSEFRIPDYATMVTHLLFMVPLSVVSVDMSTANKKKFKTSDEIRSSANAGGAVRYVQLNGNGKRWWWSKRKNGGLLVAMAASLHPDPGANP